MAYALLFELCPGSLFWSDQSFFLLDYANIFGVGLGVRSRNILTPDTIEAIARFGIEPNRVAFLLVLDILRP